MSQQYRPLQLLYDNGHTLSMAVELHDAELVVRQFSAGELPKTIGSDKVRCRPGTAPWAVSTAGLRLVSIGDEKDLPPAKQAEQPRPFVPLGGR